MARDSALFLAALALVCACKSPEKQRRKADEAAARIIADKQKEAFGAEEPFTIERPSDTLRRRLLLAQGLPYVGDDSLGTDRLARIAKWPEDYPPRSDRPMAPWAGDDPFPLSLVDALSVGARNSRDYQARKEEVFRTALDLDLARNDFSWLADGSVEGAGEANLASGGAEGVRGSGDLGASKLLKAGAILAGSIGVDIVKLLTGGRESSLGLFADTSIVVPLLRGAGRHVVLEPLTQAERNVVYALRDFDRFKRTFAVQVASAYFDVLRLLDRAQNAEENYSNLVVLSRRTRALAQAGRLPGVQVDQARQDELRARDSWIGALQAYEDRLDRFKETLGLPADARIELQRGELQRMAEGVRGHFPAVATEPGGGIETGEVPAADAEVQLDPPDTVNRGRYELDEARALAIAFANRQDLLVSRGRVYDAQRDVVVAADALRAGLTLTGSGSVGSGRGVSGATLPDAKIDPGEGLYTGSLLLDLPLERTAERNAYRNAFITLEAEVRSLQALEDAIKLQVRGTLRRMLQTRESVRIQVEAVRLARDRVTSTNLFLEAGRAQVRDVLEAQDDFLDAQNALTEAYVTYRVAELELQRDLDVLQVDAEGLWTEFEVDDEDE